MPCHRSAMKKFFLAHFILAFPLAAIDHGPLVQWFADPCHQAEIRWIQNQPPKDGDGFAVGYRIVGQKDYQWQNAASQPFAATKRTVFSASLSSLQADTVYEFAIRSSKNQEGNPDSWKFRTSPEKFRPIHFVIGGDMYHKRSLLDAMNANCGKQDPLFAALIGDLAYSNNRDAARFCEWIDSWTDHARAPDGRLIPMVVCIGNHEVDGHEYTPEKGNPGAAAATEFYSLFKMRHNGQRHVSSYNVDFGDYLSLHLLDSGHTQRISEQVDFIKESLEARKNTRFVFAAYHRPAWGTGCKPDAAEIQKNWTPLFEKSGVDAVFEHDHHTYKRTWPITAGKRDDEHGLPHLGDGAWGVDVRKPAPAEVAKRTWLAHQAPENHLIRVDLREKGFTAAAKTADGKTFDSATYPMRK